MSVQSLSTAATGMIAQEHNIDVVANNLANANTIGFRQNRANFEDLFYKELARPGRSNDNATTANGIYVGLGTRFSATQINFSRLGPLQETGQQLDLAIINTGNSFFAVQIQPIDGQEVAFTRAGHFTRNADGELVLATATDAYRLEPPVTLPPEASNIIVQPDGTIKYTTADDATVQEAGQLELARFVNPQGLKPIGGTLYIETDASGPAITGAPGEEGFGQVQQRFLEGSNVEPVEELISLIRAQRVFELNSKVITVADEALQYVSNLRR